MKYHKGRLRIYGMGARRSVLFDVEKKPGPPCWRQKKTRPPCRRPKKTPPPPAGGQKFYLAPSMILQLKNKMS